MGMMAIIRVFFIFLYFTVDNDANLHADPEEILKRVPDNCIAYYRICTELAFKFVVAIIPNENNFQNTFLLFILIKIL
jgi:hypothetical protein